MPLEGFVLDASRTLCLLKIQILVNVSLIQGYEYAALRKELLIARFLEDFKITTLEKSQSQTDKFCQYFEKKMHKGALPGLRQFLATENPLKPISIFFTLKTLFVLNIFKFLSWLFGHAEKKVWLER